jgi:hypothetical protein
MPHYHAQVGGGAADWPRLGGSSLPVVCAVPSLLVGVQVGGSVFELPCLSQGLGCWCSKQVAAAATCVPEALRAQPCLVAAAPWLSQEATEALKPVLGDYYKHDSRPLLQALWHDYSACRWVLTDCAAEPGLLNYCS